MAEKRITRIVAVMTREVAAVTANWTNSPPVVGRNYVLDGAIQKKTIKYRMVGFPVNG